MGCLVVIDLYQNTYMKLLQQALAHQTRIEECAKSIIQSYFEDTDNYAKKGGIKDENS